VPAAASSPREGMPHRRNFIPVTDNRIVLKLPRLRHSKHLSPFALDLSTLQPLPLAAAVASAFCYATGSRNYLAPILIRPHTCSPALSAEEPDTGEVYHNS
jgi:hypothetical protein